MHRFYSSNTKCIAIHRRELVLETNEAINADHQLYVIDVNMKLYFDKELADWDKINKSMIDLNKRIN